MLRVILAYFVVVALAIFSISPRYIWGSQDMPSASPLAYVRSALTRLPYIERVETAMERTNHTPQEIEAKLNFLVFAYSVMFGGYIAIALGTGLLLAFSSRESDPSIRAVSILDATMLRWIGGLFLVLMLIDLAFAWLGVHGFGDLPEEDPTYPFDFIVTTNAYILVNLLFLTMSLLATMLIVRIAVVWIHSHSAQAPNG